MTRWDLFPVHFIINSGGKKKKHEQLSVLDLLSPWRCSVRSSKSHCDGVQKQTVKQCPNTYEPTVTVYVPFTNFNLIRPFHVLLVLSHLLHHLPLIIVIFFGVIIVGASCIWWPAFLLWSDVLVASCLQSPFFFFCLILFLLLPGSSALNFQRWKLFFSHH